MKIKVVTVDYREGPENKFPSASEDVASVYRELLKNSNRKASGSTDAPPGGMLTAMSVAWFQTHGFHHQEPSVFTALQPEVSEATRPILPFHLEKGACRCRVPPELRSLGISACRSKDPMVSPINSPEILAKFPPTLLITGTRDFAMSGTLYTDTQLVKRESLSRTACVGRTCFTDSSTTRTCRNRETHSM